MNSKASRQTIEWPFLLQMSDNPSAVYPDFKSAERINAPFQNNMMSPHYKKEVKSEYLTTFDKNNNIYEIHDKALYKNGEKLFDVNNKKFVQTNVTDEYKNFIAFDYDDGNNLASLTANTDSSFTISYKGNNIRINPLYTTGRIICSRLRCLNNRPIVVIVYATSADNSAHIFIHDGTRIAANKVITWCTQKPKDTYTTTAATIGTKSVSIENINPIIHISSPIADTLAISLATNYAEQLFTQSEAYYTFIEDLNTGNFIDGIDAKPRQRTETGTVTAIDYDDFIASEDTTNKAENFLMYKDDVGIWRNVNNNEELPDQDSLEPNFYNDTIEVNGKRYQMYSANYITITYTYNCQKTQQSNHTYKFSVNIDSPISEESSVDFSGESATIIYQYKGWEIEAEDAVVTKKVIDTTDSNKEYFFDENDLAQATVTKVTENSTIGWIIGPNFFLDDGSIHSWYTFNSWGSGASYTTNGATFSAAGQLVAATSGTMNIIVESAKLVSVDYVNKQFDFTSVEWHNIYSQSVIPRNNCISVGQNFWSNSALFSTSNMRTPEKVRTDGEDDDTTFSPSKKFTSYSNSNTCDMRYYAGTFFNSDYKFYATTPAGSVDVAWFNVGGFRTKGTRGNWNILYYSSEDSISDIQGLSWSETPDMMGTLVAPWSKIDSSFYIVFTENFIVYKDTSGRLWKVSIEEGNELYSLFDSSFIIVNTTSYWNCFNIISNKKYHYATDYNNRIKYGIPRELYTASLNGSSSTVIKKDGRLNMSAINSSYNMTKDAVASIRPIVVSSSFLFSDKQYVEVYQSQAPDVSADVQTIDVYFQASDESDLVTVGGNSVTGIRYKYSILAQTTQTKIRDPNLIGVVYTDDSTSFTPDIFARFINGAGNNDFIDEQESAYPIKYNNISKPVFIYSLTGEVLNAQAFFVIQGQYYAVMNEKIYALSYYDGYIQTQDAVIDVRGMYFVGNTPEIAFFWSEKKKAFYSYTGDGILTQIFDATKYSLEKFSFKYFYDETVQSIWIPTTAGLLCFGVKNTYLMEDILEVKDIIFTADYTYILHNSGYTILKYYYEDGFEPIPIVLETSFYGAGNNEVSTIDRWQITLFDERHPKIDVKLSVRSITDVTVKAEDKVFHIGENDWDKWSHSILLSYSPKLIKGQGIRLYVESPAAIQKIVPHVADQNYSSTTKFQL